MTGLPMREALAVSVPDFPPPRAFASSDALDNLDALLDFPCLHELDNRSVGEAFHSSSSSLSSLLLLSILAPWSKNSLSSSILAPPVCYDVPTSNPAHAWPSLEPCPTPASNPLWICWSCGRLLNSTSNVIRLQRLAQIPLVKFLVAISVNPHHYFLLIKGVIENVLNYCPTNTPAIAVFLSHHVL